jgi:hypothetical protein
MYEPLRVQLATAENGQRWLTDGFVMLDVSASLVLVSDITNLPWRDGVFKLTAAHGLTPRDEILGFKVDEALELAERDAKWVLAEPTQWSVAEHPGKAMLFSADGLPCLLGESTWTALHKAYERPGVEYNTSEDHNLFRVSADWTVVAYIAGIRCPEGEEDHAKLLARSSAELAERVEEWLDLLG